MNHITVTDMSTEQHEALIPAPLSRTDIARLWREVSGATRMGPTEEEFARRVERAALEVQHELIVQLSNALMNAHDHIEMAKLRRSHATDADRIRRALAAVTQYLKGPKT